MGKRACRVVRCVDTVFAVTWRIFLFIALILCGACTKKEIKPVGWDTPDAALYATAERLFDAKSYDEALAAYQSYLVQFPGKPMADAALMKIGRIHSVKGDFREEGLAFQRLFTDYPRSSFAPDAKVAYLIALYKEGDYAAAVDQSQSFLRDALLPKNQKIRILTLIGDIHVATGAVSQATMAYANAYILADVSGQPAIWQRFRNAVGSLNAADIERFLASPPKGTFGGFFLYHLGLGFSEINRDAEGVGVLSAMVTQFPNHALIPNARRLLEMLNEKIGPGKVTIGCLLPLSGSYKAYGQRALKGIELAISQRDETNGRLTFQVIVEDTASDPTRAVEAVRQLCDAGVTAIIGPMLTAFPAAEAAQACGVPLIALTGKDGITDLGDHVFRNFLTPRLQMVSLVSYAVKVLGLKRFAMLYPEEKYGTILMSLFWDAVMDQGAIVTGAEAYRSDAVDFEQPIKKLADLYYKMPKDLKADSAAQPGIMEDEKTAPQAVAGFDAIFIPDAPEKVGMIVSQLAFYDVNKVVLLGTNLWHSDELIKAAKGYVQNAIVPDGFFLESELPQVESFVEAFKSVYGESPGFIEAVAFDTAKLISDLVSQPKNIKSRRAFREAIGAVRDYPGVTGRTSFTGNGDVEKDVFLLRIKGDRFWSVQPMN
ncbi:MAG: penicillin-binding protein activator [Desulfobacterales bacterium]|jgi:ABC-type branched-subunit amino acid transport system substrate-binding protein|nr:penicillin-binding protein activator [Desulfobacterales bacterium]